MTTPTTTLDRVMTPRGELVLRQAEGRYEVISNGVFLMDTSDGTSERMLVDAAIARCTAKTPTVLIGGLGVGFSLVAAATHKHVQKIDVIEIEPALIGWHQSHLAAITGDARQDPRVQIIEGDIAKELQQGSTLYDVICLDTDNGPNWLVFDSNEQIYTGHGIKIAHDRLEAGGVLAVWSASSDDSFERRLQAVFGTVEVLETPHSRGVPDVVYIAQRLAKRTLG